jgi:multidrug resistance efflux pump
VSQPPPIPVPLPLALRRARYQLVPIGTMIVSALLAGWLWMRHANTATATGEVAAVRLTLESKVEGVLEELPQPVQVFDSVRKGQLVARVDVSEVDKQVQRLNAELQNMRAAHAAASLLAEREAQIAELQARLQASEIKSPIDGTVMEIRRRPGEAARTKKSIMVIAGRDAPFIIGYLREDAPLRPATGMKVTIRPRGGANAHRRFESYVIAVAPQVQAMPHRLLRNPAVPEWAIQVQIALPNEAQLKPGEVVDLVFEPKSN